MMLVNCSIVLVQKEYTSISHDVLVNKEIIPNNFIKADNSFNTPVVSQINYNNGFKIISEANKIIFQFNQRFDVKELDNLDCLQNIVSKYVHEFDINYQAIGINFDFINEDLLYESFVKTCIKEDNLKFEENPGRVHSVGLSYNIKGKAFNINVKEITNSKTQAKVSFFTINVHYPSDYADNRKSIINELKENYEQSKKFIGGF